MESLVSKVFILFGLIISLNTYSFEIYFVGKFDQEFITNRDVEVNEFIDAILTSNSKLTFKNSSSELSKIFFNMAILSEFNEQKILTVNESEVLEKIKLFDEKLKTSTISKNFNELQIESVELKQLLIQKLKIQKMIESKNQEFQNSKSKLKTWFKELSKKHKTEVIKKKK